MMSMITDKNRGKRIYILIIITIIIVLSINIWYKSNIYIPCPFHKITGYYCPGCGITRMFISLIKLEFYQSFRYNPLVFILLPFIIICLGDLIFKWILGKNNYLYKKIDDKIWYALLIITILFWILRNISFFDYLIPPDL